MYPGLINKLWEGGVNSMVDYGKQRSTVKPEPMVLDENSVWVYSNITPVEETVGEETFSGWEFNMVQYDKNEYISKLQADIDYISIMSGVEI